MTEADLDAALDNRKRAFGPISGSDAETWRAMVKTTLDEGRYLGGFDGSRLVATARINGYDQWWHGREVSMGGVASVTVAPEDRGRGAGRQIMTAAIERCAELGHALSTLYPATTRIYRSLGWEHAGTLTTARLRAETLRTIAPAEPVKLRRAGVGDAAEVAATVARVYRATRPSGPISWGEDLWRVWLGEEDDYAYLAEDGFVLYRWKGSDIDVDNLVAGSEATARALWSLVGSASSVAEHVHACVEPDDPALWLTRERDSEETRKVQSWMLRVIDLPAAVAARGFPAAVTADAVVTVTDPQRPANAGTWRLEIAGGSGLATPLPGDASAPALTVNGLSALYAGVPTSTLRRSGLLAGPRDADDALDAAFAAKPYMIDYF
ncbi:GNAT family N-acetyltransferase [Bailinhaonella thermotolerans]|uniref:GNAT family N-acetyltransferase n=1 Tax=Bailinhaonella thermotolerans TaxID=1070861 RepID=A0A3A4B319_9ACTN|nr:GNAT family N-acetyltransferase [Bailinhaonella thermotolerans]